MSQSSITDSKLTEKWGQWYKEHLQVMRTVNGIDSAERFVTSTPDWPYSLAMYTIRSPEIFQDPYYQKIRGMGSWLPFIDPKYYQRNLFSGRDIAPEVKEDECLLVTNQTSPIDNLLGLQWDCLKAVGFDQSTPYRGIAVIKLESVKRLYEGVNVPQNIAIYRRT